MNRPLESVNRNLCRVLLVRDGKNDEDWLRLRRETGIGASESPTICGLGRYGTIVKLFGQKCGLIDADDETEAMRWGKILEPHILAEYESETGRQVIASQVLLQSTEHPFLIATPDGEQLAEDRDGTGVVQIKLTSRLADWAESVPDYVWAQVQHEIAVTGHGWGTAVALLGGTRLVWADVERSDEYINGTLIPRCGEFWRRVVEREPIPEHWIDGQDETTAALKALYPETAAGETIELAGDFFDVHEDLQETKRSLATLKSHADALSNRIRLAIGGATFGRLPNGITYSHKTSTRRVYDVPQHIKERFVRETEVRTLRLVAASVKGDK